MPAVSMLTIMMTCTTYFQIYNLPILPKSSIPKAAKMKNMSRNRRPKFPTYMANKKNRGETKNRKMAGQTVLVFLQVPFKENDDGMVLVLVVVMVMMMKLVMVALLVLVMMMIMVAVVVEMTMIMMMMVVMLVVVEKAVFTYLGQSFSNRVKQLPDTFCSLQQFQNYKKSIYYYYYYYYYYYSLDFKIPVELKIYLGKRTLKAAFCTEGEQIKGKFQIYP